MPAPEKREKSWKNDESLLRVHIHPAIADLKAEEVTGDDIAALLARVVRRDKHGAVIGRVQHNRVLALIKTIFNWAKRNAKLIGVELSALPFDGNIKRRAESRRKVEISRAQLDALYDAVEAYPNKGIVAAIKFGIYVISANVQISGQMAYD